MNYFPRTIASLHRLAFNLSLLASAACFHVAAKLLKVAGTHQAKAFVLPQTGGIYFEDELTPEDEEFAAEHSYRTALVDHFLMGHDKHPGIGKTQWLDNKPCFDAVHPDYIDDYPTK